MSRDEFVLVSGNKEALDETLTSAEHSAMEAFFDAIETQGDLTCLDASTKDTLERLWIIRKNDGVLDPVLKAVAGDKVFKRLDHEPWLRDSTD